jgi:hypothetical protein
MARAGEIKVASQQASDVLERPQHRLGATPRIYYLHPLLAGPLAAWPAHARRAALLGFDSVLVGPVFAPAPGGSIFVTDDPDQLHPALAADGDALAGLANIAGLIRSAGLVPLLDVVLDRVAIGGRLAAEAAWLYRAERGDFLDPRSYGLEADAIRLTSTDPHAFASWWAPRLVDIARAGFAGFRITALAAVGPANLATLIRAVRRQVPACCFLGWTPGIASGSLPAYIGSGLDFVFSSLPWWNFADRWLADETVALRRIAPVIASPPPVPNLRRIAVPSGSPRRRLMDGCWSWAANTRPPNVCISAMRRNATGVTRNQTTPCGIRSGRPTMIDRAPGCTRFVGSPDRTLRSPRFCAPRPTRALPTKHGSC